MANKIILNEKDITKVNGGDGMSKVSSDKFVKNSDGKYICPFCPNGTLEPGQIIGYFGHSQSYQCCNCKRIYVNNTHENLWLMVDD